MLLGGINWVKGLGEVAWSLPLLLPANSTTEAVPGKAVGQPVLSLPGRLLELQYQFATFRPRVSICLGLK